MLLKERVVRGHVHSEHIVQVFDTTESLAKKVAAFLGEGFSQGDQLLLAIRRHHWKLVSRRLAKGIDVNAAIADRRIVLLDAAETLEQFSPHGQAAPELFEQVVGSLVRELAARGPLRIYGEMVDVLAAIGDFEGACAVEDLWNKLAEAVPFVLFCGYAAARFGDPRVRSALTRVCNAHTHVHTDPRDELATWLVTATA